MKIGVISDTHGFLDPKVHQLFAGANHILHAGDIGPEAIITELETIAPVTKVSGNTDGSPNFPPFATVELAGRKFLVHHIVDPMALKDHLRLRIAEERPDVVVFGHTHRAFWGTIDGIAYLNPGYAGKPKSGLQRSVAVVRCGGNEICREFFQL